MSAVRSHARLILVLVAFFGWVDSTPLYGPVLAGLAVARKIPFGPLPLWFLAAHAVGLVTWGHVLDRRPTLSRWLVSAAALACALLATSFLVVPPPDWRFVLAAMGLVAGAPMVSWGRWFSLSVPAAALGRTFGVTAATIILVGKVLAITGPVLGPLPALLASLLLPLAAAAVAWDFSPAPCGDRPGSESAGTTLGGVRVRSRVGDLTRFALFIICFSLVAGLSYRFFIAVPVTPYTNNTVRLLPYVGTVLASGWLVDRRRLMTPMIIGAGMLALAFLIGAWANPAGQYVGLGLNGGALGLLESAPWLLLAANAGAQTAGRWFGWGLNLNVVPIFLGGALTAGVRHMDPRTLGLLAAVALLLAILALYGVRDPVEPLRANPPQPAAAPTATSLAGLFGTQLSTRELEVGELAVAGLSTRDIAQRLYISENTVKTHLRHVYRKTGTGGRGELLRRLLPGHQDASPAAPPR